LSCRGRLGLFAAALALVWSGRALALDHLTVQTAFYPQGPQAYLFLAQDKGWFATAGLAVDILDGRGSSYSVQVLSSGHADVGEGELLPLVFARDAGIPIKVVAEWYKNEGPAIIVPKESAIQTPKDLKGKKVLLTAAGPWPPLIDPFLKPFGLTQHDLSLVYVDSTALFTVYASGQVDALMTVDLAFSEADPLRPSRNLRAVDYGVKLPGNGLYVAEDMLAKRADVFRRFLKVCADALAYTYIEGHADEAAEAIRRQRPNTKLGLEHLRTQIAMFKAFLPPPSTTGKPIGWQSPNEWEERLAYMTNAHMLAHQHTPAEFYTNDLIDAAK
jgi:NitT/TauT family transport system substrate-binding protein